MTKRALNQLDVNGKTVLVRVDFNVPTEQGVEFIANYDHRLRATLPTIEHLVERDCKVVLCSHLGRPRGKVDESLRLAPVGERLATLLGRPVTPLNDCIGPGVSAAVAKMAPGDVCLLENLRFTRAKRAMMRLFRPNWRAWPTVSSWTLSPWPTGPTPPPSASPACCPPPWDC